MELLSFRWLLQTALMSLLLAACGGGGTATQPVMPAAIDGVFDGSGEPLESTQWHLRASGANLPAYGAAFENTGKGVKVALLDTSIQVRHPDLWGLDLNNPADGGRIAYAADFIDIDADPSPNDPNASMAWHGTAVAGTIAAAARGPAYDQGGRGLAPLAELLAFRVVPETTSQNPGRLWEALSQSVTLGARVVNNSWTHVDGTTFTELDLDWQEQLAAAMSSVSPSPVVVFAAGNDPQRVEAMSSWDTYTNSRHVIAVGAANSLGNAVAYSKPGPNVLVIASGGTAGQGLVTTDLVGTGGANPLGDYLEVNSNRTGFYGTSAAAAVASGAVALMIQANPSLGAREVAWILAATAAQASCTGSLCADWLAAQDAAIGGGRHFSHRYGFGRLDASAAVAMASSFHVFPAEKTCRSGRRVPGQTPQFSVLIPEAGSISSAYRFEAADCPSVIERVELWFQASPQSLNDVHRYSGDLHVRLISPSGRVSEMTRPHACGSNCGDVRDGFTFSSVRHMGEAPAGAWTIEVSDELAQTRSLFDAWEVRIYGH